MNSAILKLLRLHGAARVRRMRQALTNRRRLLLTIAALLLGMVWMGQTIASVLFREPYDPVTFHRWTSLILMLYFCWHIVRVAYRRPDEAIEWSAAEAEQIVGGPFTRRELLVYRFFVILTSTLPKAVLTAMVLLPDLWWSGPIGILLALVFLECFRLAIDIAVCCLSRRTYLIVRSVVFGMMLLGAAMLFRPGGNAPPVPAERGSTPSRWLGESLATARLVRDSPVVAVVERPFVVFANVITARERSIALLANGAGVVLMVGGLMLSIVWLDRRHSRLEVERQRRMHALGTAEAGRMPDRTSTVLRLPYVPRLAAIGPIVWRQLKSAGRYRGSLVVALAIPAVLSCAPLFSVRDATWAFLALVAAVVFYSFVLLPEAIKFDFRLDCDHLTQLKLLPVSPGRIVIGQLAVPVLIATLFQVTLFLFAGTIRPVSPIVIVSAIVLTVPINALFVALDNLIFLLYPHRPTQEGFEAFVRTMLKFTFKSVLLTVAGLLLASWAVGARFLADAGGMPEFVQPLFVTGIALAAWISAGVVVCGVTRAFDRLDVSVSVPT